MKNCYACGIQIPEKYIEDSKEYEIEGELVRVCCYCVEDAEETARMILKG